MTFKEITPIEMMLARWDGNMTLAAVERVNTLRIHDLGGDRASGEGRWRGSNFGDPCRRKKVMSYRGYLGAEPSEASMLMMQDGTYRHYFWQEVGLSAGFLDDIEVRVWDADLEFGGQLDGVMATIDGFPGRGGFELKTTNPRKFAAVSESVNPQTGARTGWPMPEHLMQVAAYCEVGGFDWFSVLYESRSYRMDRIEIVVRYDDTLKEKVHEEFTELHRWRDAEQLPPMLPDYPEGHCKYMCSFTAICPVATY